MSETKQFNFRCPIDLYQALEAKAEAEGVEKTAVVLGALRAQLGLPIGGKQSQADAGITLRLNQVEAQLAVVIAQLAELQTPALHPISSPTPTSPQRPPVEGQMSILAAIADHVDGWLTRKAAFEALGGNPNDPASKVPSLDGKKAIAFQTFNLPKTNHAAYGVEFSRDRMNAGQPCMRLM